MYDDPILNFFKKLPEVIPGIVIEKEEKALLNSDLFPNDIVFSVTEFNDKTWEEIEKGVQKVFDPVVVQRTFPTTPSPRDDGRGYIVRKDALWFITFSCSSSYKKGRRFELRCSVQGNRIRPSQ